ncbi:hypothetical protein [Vibrio phage vB_ValS_PJ32]|nr:hypothetical protein [Vibrio phage vB_ValS_PJ32]
MNDQNMPTSSIGNYHRLITKSVKGTNGAPVVSPDHVSEMSLYYVETILAEVVNNEGAYLVRKLPDLAYALDSITSYGFIAAAALGASEEELTAVLKEKDNSLLRTSTLQGLSDYVDNALMNRVTSAEAWLSLLSRVTMLNHVLGFHRTKTLERVGVKAKRLF